MLGSLDSVRLVVFRRSLIEPPCSHSIESAKRSACKEIHSYDNSNCIFTEAVGINIGENSRYSDAYSYEHPNSQEFEKITCRMLTRGLDIPQYEKVMIAFAKRANGLVPSTFSLGVFQLQPIVSMVEKP